MKSLLASLLLAVCLRAQTQVIPGPPIGGAEVVSTKYTVTAIENGVNGCLSSSIGAAAFTGAGLNDATSGGTYTGTGTVTFTVEIDGTGTPDTFKWKKGAGSYTTGVAITGSAQTLSDGVTVTFAATTGHTATDLWTIAANDLGCWQVNGVLGADKTAGLTQNVTLFSLPAGGFVSNYRIKSATACTGTTTLKAGLGTASSSDLFLVSATGYNLKTAVSATNFTTAAPLVVGSDTTAAVNLVVSLTSTVENIDQIAAGCSFNVWVAWNVLP